MQSDAKAIAAGLSKAERTACSGRILHITKRDGLVAKGILTPDGGRQWTPLGLAVKAQLERTDDDRPAR